MKIVLYKDDYRREIIDFVEKIAIGEYGFDEWKDALENFDFEPYKQEGSRLWIVLDKNNKIIGVCAGLKKSDDVIKFNTFYVDKSFRSEGIGARLYEEFMNYAKEYKYKTIILGTCERLNLAIRFYEKRGFELYKTDGEDRYYKKDIMQKIGIIAAEVQEMEAVKEKMQNIKETKLYNSIFYEGTISNKNCVLARAGEGKVNAARTTQILIDKFEVEAVINVGSAGGLNPELDYEDIVVSTACVQHDFDITAFGREKGYIPNIEDKYMHADKTLLEKATKAIEETKNKVIKGIIATGDVFVAEKEKRKELYEQFNAECVEMEGAAVAQVCHLDNIPFIIIRSISDKANGNEKIDFEKYLEVVSKRCAEYLEKMLAIV